MANERAEKRIDQLPELETVEDDVLVPGEYNGIAYQFKAKGLKEKASAGAGLTDEVKQALLTIAQKVAYIDEHGQTYYDALYNALYPPAELVAISAVFAQGGNTVYDTDSLDSLKPYLTVTGVYDDGTSKTVTNYTLSGTLAEGSSTITVTASGKTAAFTVSVTHKVAQVTGVTAVFTQGSEVIYDNASLDDLKPYLVVTASYDDGTSAAVSGYTLSGTLAAGTSTITASYGGFSDTFTVTVTERPVTLISITAVFTQGQNVIYDTDSLDALKQYLVVTAHYDDNTDTVVSDYTLSGTLTAGTSTITASYGGKSDTFAVSVTAGAKLSEYVQSGLLHQWDGILNTASGHDGNATSWEDLVGNYPINKTNPGAVWLENALFFNPTRNDEIQAWTGSGSLNPTDTMTIEMVVDFVTSEAYPDGRAGMIGHFASYGTTKQRRFGASKSDASIGVYCNESNGFAATGITANRGVHTITGTYTTTTKSDGVYINGVAKTKGLNHTYGEDIVRDYVIIGSYDHLSTSSSGNVSYAFLGKIYAIRIYNRVLSASEIASNHAVDVRRFHLEE